MEVILVGCVEEETKLKKKKKNQTRFHCSWTDRFGVGVDPES